MFHSLTEIPTALSMKTQSFCAEETSGSSTLSAHRTHFWAALAVFVAAFEVLIDSWTWIQRNVSILYVLPLVIAVFARNRKVLWSLGVSLVAATFVVYLLQIPPGNFSWREPFFVNRVLASITVLLTCVLLQARIQLLDAMEAKEQSIRKSNHLLAASNRELLRYKEEITRKNEELEQRRQEADAASDRKTRMLASASHDMRSPLNAILMISALLNSVLKERSGESDVMELAGRIDANTHHLADLLGEVLDISTFESGRVQLKETEFPLNELLSNAFEMMRPIAAEKNIAFFYAPLPSACCIRTDRMKLERVINNLLSNAIKFTDRGSVTLRGEIAPSGEVRIEIRDTGIGIPQDKLDVIFDDFVQLPGSVSNRVTGWGLGLAICRRLVELLGGTLAVQSEMHSGSLFTAQFPATHCCARWLEAAKQRTMETAV